MGLSWDDIRSGVLDTGKLIAETTTLWNALTGKDSSEPAAVPAQPVVSNLPAAQMTGFQMDTTQWALIIGALVLFALLIRR